MHNKPEITNKQMAKFVNGFKRFQKAYFGDNTELFDSLKQGQSPKTLLIGCCDSRYELFTLTFALLLTTTNRVDPAIITDCDPGDLFIVRNVANLVAPYNADGSHHGVSAALEFAVKGLKVTNIVVMGHTKCGGIAALMRGITDSNETEFLGPWMKIAEKARKKVLKHFSQRDMDTQNRACEHASILLSLENLVGYPWVRERLMNQTISIHGWYFDFEDGELLALDPETLVFEPLVEATESRLEGLNLLREMKTPKAEEEHETFT
ncbi:carbonate dehydratase [Rhizoclosmatium globosum]|uniref:Carbonic anhydrase n=1 Tax=Rhizoclosmatium globosum TaxID=329046 RepID=A0A1Y2CHR0_9FUNG|nr:carbonate dehydratase [Rhizoclosmatium globosum]|eukprot:ORY46447.1 carbonate dehydratase [Rhizoclosmatium globosum]